jgi:hypothetical protein
MAACRVLRNFTDKHVSRSHHPKAILQVTKAEELDRDKVVLKCTGRDPKWQYVVVDNGESDPGLPYKVLICFCIFFGSLLVG